MKKRINLKSLLILLLIVLMSLGSLPVQASSTSEYIQPVLDARAGIVQVNVSHVDDNGVSQLIQGGSGFLVGPATGTQTIITNYHIVHLTEATEEEAAEYFQVEKLKTTIEVVVKRDVVLTATIVNESQRSDFAILQLEQPIYDREPLKMADSDELIETQDVYALGFYDMLTWNQDDRFYTSEDVNIAKGTVSKRVTMDSIPYIQHSSIINQGNSGGPLINSNGAVVGLNTLASNDDYFYSLQSNEIREVLDALGVEYDLDNDTTVIEPPVETKEETEETQTEPETEAPIVIDEGLVIDLRNKISEAKAMDTSAYTDDSVLHLTNMISDAEGILDDPDATNSQLSSALKKLEDAMENMEDKGSSIPWLIIILVAIIIIAVVAIIVIVISSSNKKKKTEEQMRRAPQPRPVAPVNPSAPRPAGAPNNAGARQPARQPANYVNDGAGETSLLNDGSGETTVLNANNQTPAIIQRKKNNERITINKPVFKLGKERINVDYCVSGNNSVSRVHAEIQLKNGEYYLVDQGSTNRSYVNGAAVTPYQPEKLENGAVFKLADEEFTFRLH